MHTPPESGGLLTHSGFPLQQGSQSCRGPGTFWVVLLCQSESVVAVVGPPEEQGLELPESLHDKGSAQNCQWVASRNWHPRRPLLSCHQFDLADEGLRLPPLVRPAVGLYTSSAPQPPRGRP